MSSQRSCVPTRFGSGRSPTPENTSEFRRFPVKGQRLRHENSRGRRAGIVRPKHFANAERRVDPTAVPLHYQRSTRPHFQSSGSLLDRNGIGPSWRARATMTADPIIQFFRGTGTDSSGSRMRQHLLGVSQPPPPQPAAVGYLSSRRAHRRQRGRACQVARPYRFSRWPARRIRHQCPAN